MSATSIPPSYSISTVGALTTVWTPPDSCLFTTTSYGDQLFQGGYIPAVGTDSACYPPRSIRGPSGTITTAATPAPEKRQVFDNSISLYSPGLCPSGWNYVASFVTVPAGAVQESTLFTYTEPQTTGTGVNTYFCCPGFFQLDIATSMPFPTILMNYMSCTYVTSSFLENIFNLDSSTSWPSALPTPLPVYTTEFKQGLRPQPSCTSVTVTASGIAVAWSPTDTAVMNILQNATYWSEEAYWLGIPAFPPQYPTPLGVASGCLTSQTKHLLEIILPTVLVGGLFLLCFGCWAVNRRRRRRAGMGLPTRPVGEEQVPLKLFNRVRLKSFNRASPAGDSGGQAYEPMRRPEEGPPPAYDEVVDS